MKILIIGNGVAAVTAAQTLSKEPDLELTILGEEKHLYYARPRLWSYIAGEIAREELFVRSEDWYEEKKIRVVLGEKATAILPNVKQVHTVSGEEYTYDRLLLATGARAFIPPIPGAALDGVFVLRTLEDAEAIREKAEASESAAVIGGGLLGLEIARVLLGLGLRVTVLEAAPQLLPRQLDEDGGRLLSDLLQEMGLSIRTGVQVEKIEGAGEVASVHLQNGERVPADLVLLSTGIRSNNNLAQQAGLRVGRAVEVDQYLQTSAEHIYAAGDAAEFQGRVYGIIPAAIEQARAAAASISGSSASYEGTIPSTQLKVTGIALSSVGQYQGECEDCQTHKVLDTVRKQYRKIVVQDGIIKGAILVNDQERSAAISRLIRTRKDVSAYEEQLLSDSFDIKTLTR